MKNERLAEFLTGHLPTINKIYMWHSSFYYHVMKSLLELHEQRFGTMNSNSDIYVRERRLRPVYELLDSGNNKKVITEVDKLLKKQPTFTCAKVLKALALVRLNKNDEAESILDPIHKEVPTDDGTIQALSICYRELEQPESLCSFLELACKKEQTEELLTHCFMAQVRVSEFQKQHLTAMTLFKLYNKPNYFYWAVASLLIKYEQAEEGKKEPLSLQLAERMMEKVLTEPRGTPDENCISLYVNALEKQEKWEKMLEVLVKYGHGHPQSPWCNSEFHRFYCHALKKLDKMDDLFEYLKATFFKNPDEYDVLKQMILVFGDSHPQWIQDFFDHLIKNQPSRVVALADLFYCRDYLGSLDSQLPRVEVDLDLAIEFGAEKPSFSSDIAEYYPLISRLNVKSYLVNFEVDKYDTVGKIIRDVNYEIFMRALIPEESPLTRFRRANRCFGKYLASEEAMKKLRTANNMRTKESEFFDQFIVIAASSLLGENVHSRKSNNIEDYAATILQLKEDWSSVHNLSPDIQDMHKRIVYESEPGDENVPVKEISGKYMLDARIEYLVFIAAAMLEYGLERSPHNYSIRILLSRIYSLVGANYNAVKMIQGLDLKHIQLETLGYLIFQEAINGGLYTDVHRMLCQAESMYTSFRKESMEHIITCYKYNSFLKVGEFLGFRDQIFCSSQYKSVITERRLMELMVNGLTPIDMKKICDTISKELNLGSMLKNPHGDNRDFTVLEGFVAEGCLSQLKLATADLDIQYFKIRLTILLLLSKLLAHAPLFVSSVEKCNIVALLKTLEDLVQGWEPIVEVHNRAFEKSSIPDALIFQGLWPPSYARYYETGGWNAVIEMVRFLLEVASHSVRDDKDADPPQLDRLTNMIFDSCETMLNDVKTRFPEDQLGQIPYLKIRELIESIHYCVETFSFFRIIISIAVSLFRDKYDLKNSAAKKKSRAKGVDERKARANCIQTTMIKFKELHSYAIALHTTISRRPLETFDSTEATWKTLLKPSFLYKAIPHHYNRFLWTMKESHDYQTREIVKACASLMDYLRLLQP